MLFNRYYSGHSDALGGLLIVPTAHEKELLRGQRTVMGNQPGNLEAWLLIRSCRTLPLRVARQCETAAKLVCWQLVAFDGRRVAVVYLS